MQNEVSTGEQTLDPVLRSRPRSTCRWGRVVVISPHLDDAVFSCGALIATCRSPLTLTVFAGVPPSGQVLTDWDASCGFVSAQQALHCRKREDRVANDILGARVQHLPFLDAQYGHVQDRVAIAATVEDVLVQEQSDTVFFPLGLFHSDHVLVHDAMMGLRKEYGRLRWIMYEDALYRRKAGLLKNKLQELHDAQYLLSPFIVDTDYFSVRKQQAVLAYVSQLAGTGLAGVSQSSASDNDTVAPEGYWLLH